VTQTPERARSFGAAAAAYAKHRPGYPAAAVAWALEPTSGRDFLDLGAGTGKLTEGLLAVPGARVTAVDPDPAMLAELRARFPDVPAYEGSAEAIPLPDASVDAVLLGQAWHWVDQDEALPEVARVLRPGGVLAALWNADDGNVEWVAGYNEEAGRGRPVSGMARGGDQAELRMTHPAFGPAELTRFTHSQRLTIEGLIDVLRTHSWALTSEPADREASFARIRAYLAARPETSAGEFDLPMITIAARAVRRRT
jgi:SAM-dependent methyltransferase